jgi:hypothetical protein
VKVKPRSAKTGSAASRWQKVSGQTAIHAASQMSFEQIEKEMTNRSVQLYLR